MNFQPVFRPDFSPELLRSYNYLRDLVVVRSSLLSGLPNLPYAIMGAAGYDAWSIQAGFHEAPRPVANQLVPEGEFIYLSKEAKKYTSLPCFPGTRIKFAKATASDDLARLVANNDDAVLQHLDITTHDGSAQNFAALLLGAGPDDAVLKGGYKWLMVFHDTQFTFGAGNHDIVELT